MGKMGYYNHRESTEQIVCCSNAHSNLGTLMAASSGNGSKDLNVDLTTMVALAC